MARVMPTGRRIGRVSECLGSGRECLSDHPLPRDAPAQPGDRATRGGEAVAIKPLASRLAPRRSPDRGTVRPSHWAKHRAHRPKPVSGCWVGGLKGWGRCVGGSG